MFRALAFALALNCLAIQCANAASFANTGTMNAARWGHTATLLLNGKVLVTGGTHSSSGDIFPGVELYDPASGTWAATNSMNVARFIHTATLLSNGKVLVAGGLGNGANSSAEIFDPASGTWTATGTTMNSARYGHTATLLSNGKVLVAGGSFGDNIATNSAEIFDPATGTWTVTGTMTASRWAHTATLLPNGRVLVAGGLLDSNIATDSAELYNPATGTWTTTSALSINRTYHTAALLPSGQVLVAGGATNGATAGVLSSMELYNPTTGIWTMTATLNTARGYHAMTLLPNGNVLFAGGFGSGFSHLSKGELYDSVSRTWATTGSLNTNRVYPTATLLLNGQVLVAGGQSDLPAAQASAELYDNDNASPLIPFPPQKIFLAFNQPSTFGLIVPNAFGKAWPVVNPFGSLPAASVSDSYRTTVTSQIKAAFSRSGIQNIEWTTSDAADAIAVYFCPTVNPDLLGYSKGSPDRFNSKRRGEVIVFVNENFPSLDAESAAHEIGHALGLRHVDPSSAADPNNQEVMDLFPSVSPEFINAVSDVTDFASFSTHNPLYHLLRYVDGWSTAQLQNAGINPGSWDIGSSVNTHFSFQNSNLRLYNITIYASGGSAESSFTLEQIPSATLAELAERSFSVPEGLGVVLLASSVANGSPDVISSTGDAFSATNQIISPNGTNSFSLFRQDSPTNAVSVSTATATFDAQSPYCNIAMSAPSVIRLDFRGTLQRSTNLTDWADIAVGSVSPQFIVLGTNDTVGFFRSKK